MNARKVLVSLSVVLLVAGAAASIASAGSGTTKYNSKIWMIYVPEISADTDSFEGQVTSPKGGCVEKRKVEVFREKAGSDALVGSAKTTDEGFWFVHVPAAVDGSYYAQVKKRNIGTSKRKRICKAASSKPVVVPAVPVTVRADSVPTKVKLRVGSSGVYTTLVAKLKSENDKCLAVRELKLFREAGGEDVGYYVGSTTTGVWTVFLDEYPGYPPPGDYYVKVTKRVIDGKHHKVRCAAARSNTVELG